MAFQKMIAFGGSRNQEEWFPAIDIALNSTWSHLGLTAKNKTEDLYFFRCDCGAYEAVDFNVLRTRTIPKCNQCSSHDPYSKANNKKIHRAWCHMIARCENPKTDHFRHYGGRGITICSEWRMSFRTFAKWSKENGYASGLTIERKNVDAGYFPANCMWASWKVQQNNKRNNRVIEFRGKTQTLMQWSEELGIGRIALTDRIDRCGWSIEKAFTEPYKYKARQIISYNGEAKLVAEWAAQLGIKTKNLSRRLRNGMSLDVALSGPMRIRK